MGRRADEDAVEADRQRRRERDALGEDLPAVGRAVAIRVLQDQDLAVARAGEAAAAGLVVAVLGDPHAAAVVPGEGHGLGDHGLRGPGVDLVAVAHGHRLDRLLRGQELLLLRLLLGDAPERRRGVRALGGARVALPVLGQFEIVQLAGVDDQAVADDLGRAFRDVPVAHPRPCRPHAELAVHPPRLGVAGVHRVVEDGDVEEVVAAFDLHADVDPHRPLAFGLAVALPRRVDRFAGGVPGPGHAQEHAAVGHLVDRDVAVDRLAGPFEVEDEAVFLGPHGPVLGLGHEGVAFGVQHPVDRLPLHLGPGLRHHGGRLAPPVVATRVVEVVAADGAGDVFRLVAAVEPLPERVLVHRLAVDAGEAPVEPGLVRVMPGAVLGRQALAVRSDDRVQEGPVFGAGVLGDDRFVLAFAVDRDRAGFLVLDGSQRHGLGRLLGGRFPGARALRATGAERRQGQ